MNLPRAEWNNLWIRLGSASNSIAPFDALQQLYNEPTRHYHNARHIVECLAEFRRIESSLADSTTLELALWFHDAIYDPHRHDNEEQSASLMAQLLSKTLSPDRIAKSSQLIMATKHLSAPVDPAEQLIVDIDLSILGQPPARFDEYEEQIRREYAFVPEQLFREKRAQILQSFLARDQIYQAADFHDRYEIEARKNLNRSIAKLSQPEIN